MYLLIFCNKNSLYGSSITLFTIANPAKKVNPVPQPRLWYGVEGYLLVGAIYYITTYFILFIMVEHYTRAFVLAREPKGELDAALTLYTKDLGKVVAKIKSIRRITSKLSGHLVPGSLANIRIVERNGNGHQVVDALSTYVEINLESLRFLDFVNKLTPVGVPDLHLWHELESTLIKETPSKNAFQRIIYLMGYDPKNAACDNCGSRQIAYFVPRDIMFLCARCFTDSRAKQDEAFPI